MFFRHVSAALAVAALATLSSAATPVSQGVEVPSSAPELNAPTVHGCYSSLAELKLNETYRFNTQSWCTERCTNNSMPVAGTYAKGCYCGEKYPNSKYVVSDSKCTEPCPGFGEQACGGLNTFTISNTGLVVAVDEYEVGAGESSTSSVSSSTTTSAGTTATSATDSQVTVTAPAQSETNKKSGGSGSGTVGIAVGVVVGVLAAAGIAAGAFFFVRRRRNSELEEEHRRNAAVNAFISGGKPPSSSGGMSMADSRMDPVMNRRLSDGSIADNQDYSRRILRVTNA